MIFGVLDQAFPAMNAPTVTLRPSDSRCGWHEGRMLLAGPVVKKISLIKRIIEVEPLLRHTYENAAAYLFGDASQVTQDLAILVALTAGGWPYHSLAKLVAPSVAKVISSLRRFPSPPPANFHSFCEPFPLACLHNNEGSSRRIFPVSRSEPHHLG